MNILDNDFKLPFIRITELDVDHPVRPYDIVSSSECNCLFISDRDAHKIDAPEYYEHKKIEIYYVYRVDVPSGLRDDNSETKIKPKKWKVKDKPDGLSVTPDGKNVIIACDAVRKLKEYTTDGKLVRVISLPDDMVYPSHAVKVNENEFVVCHGNMGTKCRIYVVEVEQEHTSSDDDIGQWCVKHCDGEGIKFTSGARVRKNQYLRLVFVNGTEPNSVFAIDLGNRRVLHWLHGYMIDKIDEIVSRGDICTQANEDNWLPYRMCYDVKRGLLYLAVCRWFDPYDPSTKVKPIEEHNFGAPNESRKRPEGFIDGEILIFKLDKELLG